MERNPENFVRGLVSVITPVYNCEKYIDRTLQSVFKQTYKDIEIILVDDCSIDKSAEIIQRYQVAHPEIFYFLQHENKGAGYARNKALELAKGQYVAFLDADDVWKPNKIEKQLNLLRDKNGAFCFTAIEMIDDEDRVIKGKREVKEEVDYNFLLSNTMIPTSSVLIDRSIMGDFRMSVRRGGQDYATWLRLLRNRTKAYGLNEALTEYRLAEKSLSSNKLSSIRQLWEIQRYDERICSVKVILNVVRWSISSIKKYEMGYKDMVNMINREVLGRSGGI